MYCQQTIILKLSHVVTIIHSTIQDGYTALRTASFNGQHKMVELLLGAGANPDLQNKVRTQQDRGVHSNLSNVNGTSSCETRSPRQPLIYTRLKKCKRMQGWHAKKYTNKV